MFSHQDAATPTSFRKVYALPPAIMTTLNEAFAVSADARNAYEDGEWAKASRKLRRDGLGDAAFALEIYTPYLYDE